MNEMKITRRSLLDFEKLIVYQKAMIFRRRITPLTSNPPRKAADLVDHLDRAADSILLNIGEGSGCIPKSKDRFRFNRIALKSAEYSRSLRYKGLSVRNTLDLMVATFCIENNYPLLYTGRSFVHFENHFGLVNALDVELQRKVS